MRPLFQTCLLWGLAFVIQIRVVLNRRFQTNCDAYLSFYKMKNILTKSQSVSIIRNMSNNQEKDVERFAEVFKALSNPNRLKIFLRLISCCQPGTVTQIKDNLEPEACACVGELGQDLGIVPSTISHHIKELRQAGLIRMERRGQKIACSIDPETMTALKGFF